MTQTFFKRLYFSIVGQDTDAHTLEVRDAEGKLQTTPFYALVQKPPVSSGTAILVAGTKVVANTNITSTSRIRLFYTTKGGTPGACFVKALTAGTSFEITSTSNTDTSTIGYEILSY